MKNIFTAAVIATASLCVADAVTALQAKAEITEGTILGYHAEIFQSGSMDRPDFITIYGPQGKETIKVTCAPWDWESTGPNTANWVDAITEEWCFN